MCYHWNVGDADQEIVAGAQNAINWQGVIQPNDGHGGYNTTFTLPPGVLGSYHVHFAHNSTQVAVIRYFDANGNATNVVTKVDDCAGRTINNLFNYWTNWNANHPPNLQFPNSVLMLQHFRNTLANVQIGINNQYQ